MGKIYLTSDLHFCHDKEFIYGPRGFKNIWDMNKAIVENWNSTVTEDDDVYVLGDLMLNNNEEGIKLIKSLRGRIHIVTGNHDTYNRVARYRNTFNVVMVHPYATELKYKKYKFYLSHYPTMTSNYDDKGLYGLINLCGHVHTQNRFLDMDKGLIYHCELDAHDMKPILIDDIIEDIKKYYKEK